MPATINPTGYRAVSNIITSPFFVLATQANRGKTARERRAGVAGLIELSETAPCRWTAASAASDLGDFHGIRSVWNRQTETYEIERCPKLRRRNSAEIVCLAAKRHDQTAAREIGDGSRTRSPAA